MIHHDLLAATKDAVVIELPFPLGFSLTHPLLAKGRLIDFALCPVGLEDMLMIGTPDLVGSIVSYPLASPFDVSHVSQSIDFVLRGTLPDRVEGAMFEAAVEGPYLTRMPQRVFSS